MENRHCQSAHLLKVVYSRVVLLSGELAERSAEIELNTISSGHTKFPYSSKYLAERVGFEPTVD